MKRRCRSLSSEEAGRWNAVELGGDPGHEDEGCMALRMTNEWEMIGQGAQRNIASNTGFSSMLVTGPQLTLSNEPQVRSAFKRLRTAYKVHELVHNLLAKKTSKIHLQVRGHACCLVFHVWSTAFCHLSKIEKSWLSQLSGYGERTEWRSQSQRPTV